MRCPALILAAFYPLAVLVGRGRVARPAGGAALAGAGGSRILGDDHHDQPDEDDDRQDARRRHPHDLRRASIVGTLRWPAFLANSVTLLVTRLRRANLLVDHTLQQMRGSSR